MVSPPRKRPGSFFRGFFHPLFPLAKTSWQLFPGLLAHRENRPRKRPGSFFRGFFHPLFPLAKTSWQLFLGLLAHRENRPRKRPGSFFRVSLAAGAGID